ncbi:MAG: hypothetical protein EA392_08030 [Cryomorphaceae bacterium]|nr:MAG: hypothetical protein EA392_08030 [Cryomorphaceae bacterium]
MCSRCAWISSARRALGLFFWLMPLFALAQPFGNEWINYNQRYYKFKVWEEGVYRIPYNTLAAAGIPLATIDPRTIQVYSRENEVPIYVHGEEDGTFNLTDYIELYATGNDGWLDVLTYNQPQNHTNPGYSLYNDTIYYYITWEEGNLNNLRYQTLANQELDDLEPTPFVWRTSNLILSNIYHPGEMDVWGASSPLYTAGEGWVGLRVGFPTSNAANPRLYQIPSGNAYTGPGAPQAEFRTTFASLNSAGVEPGQPNHHVQIASGTGNNFNNLTIVYDETFFGYKVVHHNWNVPSSVLGNNNSAVGFRTVNDLGVAADQIAAANITLQYPMVPNLAGSSGWNVHIPSDGSGQLQRFRFEGIGQNPVVYARGNAPRRIVAQPDGNFWQVGIPQTGSDVIPCYVVAGNAIQTVTQVKAAGIAGNGILTNFATFNVDSAYVIVTHNKLLAAAQTYAAHRNLRFNTFVVDVEELYDQFGGGIEKCGLAVRRFSDFLLTNWTTPPQYLFLVGKSIREAVGNAGQNGARKVPAHFERNLVPSFGYPSSDNLITRGLQNNPGWAPALRTGRLAAETPQDVIDYLNKVQTFENQPPAEWMKNVMHFGGGVNNQEQNTFQGFLNDYKAIISDTCFGGNVHSFFKTSQDPISINLSAEISDLINGGVSLMTFFGHAGGTGFDQSIDDPNNFEWNGRFPFLIGNACFTGDIHQPGSNSTSENFLLLQNKGVIGFLSTVELGFANTLNVYSKEFYKQLSSKNYGGTVGDHMRKTIQLVSGETPGIMMQNQVLGMTLHGDPAIVLNSFPKPDYAISESSVFFDPPEVTAIMDSLTINVALKNIGKATNQSFDVVVERKFPDNGADSVYVVRVDHLHYKDTVRITMPVQPERSLGINTFDVSVDLPSVEVDELDNFGNNVVLGVQLNITSGGIIPVYPYRYAVVADPQISLKASTGDIFASETAYRFQVDTTRSFNSPFLTQQVLTQNGGVIEWPLPFTMTDSTVYFWRVAIDDAPLNELKWRESSFQYIPEKTGWGQAHFQQFKDNFFGQLVYNEPDRLIDFFSGTVNLRCNVLGNSTSLNNEVALDLNIIEYGGCANPPAMHVVVLDPTTFEAWGTAVDGQNPQNDFGNQNTGSACRNRVEYFFIFRQNNEAQMQGFSDMVLNAVPNGHYLLIYTWRFLVETSLSNTNFYNTMSQLGSTVNPTEHDSIPYIFFVRKGDGGSVEEIFGADLNDVIQLNTLLQASGDEGVMVSPPAGPVAEWGSFHYRFHPRENPSTDSVGVRLRGITTNNTVLDIPGSQTSGFSFDKPELSNWVDASEYPRLRIRTRLKDTENQTPAQLRRWHLLHDEVPDAAVNPAAWFVFESPEVDQGEQMLVSYGITNVSTVDMDSLLVRYWVVRENNTTQEIDLRRIAPLPAGETIIDSLIFDSWGLSGSNQFRLEINPINPQTGQFDQLEHHRFNNFLQVGFKVSRDVINPLLDVTFDGLHILDGEIVSANPEISISLTDENMFLMMNEDADTSNFEIFISPPGGEFERHYFYQGGMPNMQWIPASGGTNRFQILYRPRFDLDGTHTLLVRATDKSGNPSGEKDYRISFEVINQSTITDVLNYPNPFSTKTHFVFTLTGSEVPDYIKIQIMTISGKIVREITHMELGPIRVGRNITDFYWDGTDMYGDRLANGVYLYRVIAKIHGQSITKRETGASQYFRQEFGKMYLIR